MQTVVVAALTINPHHAAFPGNVAVPAGVCDLDDDSIINVTQLLTTDRRALETPLGALPDWLMALVDDGLRLRSRSDDEKR